MSVTMVTGSVETDDSDELSVQSPPDDVGRLSMWAVVGRLVSPGTDLKYMVT